MPCSDEGYGPTERETHNTNAFPAACEMAKLLTVVQYAQLSKNTQEWIVEHNRYDREREDTNKRARRHERVIESALSKLTDEEREALRVR